MLVMDVQPVTLKGKVVRLEPLREDHAQDLFEASQDQSIWRWMPTNPSGSLEEIHSFIATALRARNKGSEMPFATIDVATGRAIGSTRYLEIQPANRGIEIGWTWLAKSAQRTGINTECKYLLLRHAFETLNAIRVQIKTDSRNTVSQQAIERIGGVKEGILRKQRINADGYQRDAVYYSIIDTEWPDVKTALEAKMRSYTAATL